MGTVTTFPSFIMPCQRSFRPAPSFVSTLGVGMHQRGSGSGMGAIGTPAGNPGTDGTLYRFILSVFTLRGDPFLPFSSVDARAAGERRGWVFLLFGSLYCSS